MSLPVTEDTPPDMLAGSMDLKVILPAGQTVKMSIQRGTPMMDLLVQVTTAHCLNPGDYSLQAMGDKGVLPFKPSTPIGALDTFTVKIVEKKLHGRGRAPQVPQSFLNTFRLQVHLPRSQLFVIRVTPDVTLSEIMTHICTEKNLNLDKYEFRNPGNLDEVLELDKTLGYYKLQELSMMSKGNRAVTGLMSSADIINVKSSKHRQNSVCDSSLSSGSFGSRSGSPVPAINVVAMPPQPPIRKKRRPAPKPPSFAENEKKDQTNGSVLISHSRESSDSSGYHEASVLSESPTHGGPAGRMENDSPPDTLPRRSKLPPSQSFTNLTSIQPAPRARLSSSVSNTSLNSNGHSRKKRAPPPPPTQTSKGDKAKSSTLPTSVTEERRNGSSLSTSETNFRPYKVDEPVDESDTKVQIPVDITSDLVNETKASKDEVLAPLDVDVRVAPKPKPRTVVPTPGATSPKNSKDLTERKSGDGFRRSGRLNRWNNFENLTEEEAATEDSGDVSNNEKFRGKEESKTTECKFYGSAGRSAGGVESEDVKSCLLVGSSADVHEKSPPAETEDQGDHDSINWEYQLPPPPTDFRDTNSPSCTEFGTITITPEVLESLGESKKESSDRVSTKTEPPIQESNSKSENNDKERLERSESQNHHFRPGSDKKVPQNKVAHEVMYELTNVLNENKKCKEKSLSVSNLYINDSNPKDLKRNALNYSKSFSTEPVSSLKNFQLTTYQPKGLDRKSSSNEIVYNNEITSRNYKNLEKSSSMECIQTKSLDSGKFIEKTEDGFRKPVAPVQKKLKVAKRSASSIGVNTSSTQKRNAAEGDQEPEAWEDDANISVLRQQFLEFLKEKKLMNNDLNMSSLDVIRNILPELNGGEKNVRNHSHSHVNVVVNQKKETNSQGNAQWEPKEKKNAEDKVKIIDVKVKSSLPAGDEVVVRHETKVRNSPPEEHKVVVRHDSKVRSSLPAEDEVVLRRELKVKSPPAEEEEAALRRDAKREVKAEVQRENPTKSSPEKKQEVGKRYSYQGPPSINFGTWGERPKTTKIIIKDEDYVTHEKVTEKKSEMVQNRNGEVGNVLQKPKEAKKPAQIVIKKPGVLSHYEMFSALPRKKEISSLELVHMEDEERKRRTERSEPKEFNRVPVVCGVELKKVFKSPPTSRPTSFPSPEPPIEPEIKPKHSVSVYVNGNQDVIEKERTTTSMPCYSFILPKRNSAVMPVVKGFRPLEDNATTTNHVNISNHSNHININISSKTDDGGPTANHWSSPSKRQQASVALPPPPPPNISFVKLKPVSSGPGKPKPISQDLRGQLLTEIQNFRGLRKLKKSPAY